MLKHRRLTLAGFITAVVTVLLASVMQADESVGPQGTVPGAQDFQGKMVLVEIDNATALESDSHSVTLREAVVIRLGDRYYIRGRQHIPKYLGEAHSIYEDVDTWVALDKVVSLNSFTPEQFDRFVEYWMNRDE